MQWNIRASDIGGTNSTVPCIEVCAFWRLYCMTMKFETQTLVRSLEVVIVSRCPLIEVQLCM